MTSAIDTSKEPISSRPMQSDADFWRVRELLVETALMVPPGFNWEVRRWDGKRFYDQKPGGDPAWSRGGQIWLAADGTAVGAVHPDGTADAYLQLHPDYPQLAGQMLAWAEANLAAPFQNDPQPRLHLFVYAYDALRQRLLQTNEYEQTQSSGVIRRLRLGRQPLVTPSVASGYTLRTTNPDDLSDCQQIADLLNAAFNRTFHNAAEFQNFARQAPCYRRELDLVAVAPDGRFAAYTGIPYDESNRRAIFEPVCTHPAHRRKGLGKALMQDGLRRLRQLGAVDVLVETGDMIPANRLYDSLGFTEKYSGYYWRKQF